MRLSSVIILICLCIAMESYAQVILLENKRNFKFVKIYQGDVITYQRKEFPGVWKRAKIKEIYETFITCEDDVVPIEKISAIKIKRQSLNYKGDGKLLIIGGLFFTSVSVINDVINQDPVSFTKTQLIVYPALILTGFILRKIPDKTCVIGNKYSLGIVKL